MQPPAFLWIDPLAQGDHQALDDRRRCLSASSRDFSARIAARSGN
jgi:hypothetical protein